MHAWEKTHIITGSCCSSKGTEWEWRGSKVKRSKVNRKWLTVIITSSDDGIEDTQPLWVGIPTHNCAFRKHLAHYERVAPCSWEACLCKVHKLFVGCLAPVFICVATEMCDMCVCVCVCGRRGPSLDVGNWGIWQKLNSVRVCVCVCAHASWVRLFCQPKASEWAETLIGSSHTQWRNRVPPLQPARVVSLGLRTSVSGTHTHTHR